MVVGGESAVAADAARAARATPVRRAGKGWYETAAAMLASLPAIDDLRVATGQDFPTPWPAGPRPARWVPRW